MENICSETPVPSCFLPADGAGNPLTAFCSEQGKAPDINMPLPGRINVSTRSPEKMFQVPTERAVGIAMAELANLVKSYPG